MTPILSVLIPSVPSRRELAWKLFDKISGQAAVLPDVDGLCQVEVLLLLDNKMRTVGKKRGSLVRASRGDYVTFVDDDDDVSDDYVSLILQSTGRNPDLIVFDSHVTINGIGPTLCQHGIAFENEQYRPEGFKRKPWHIHAWRGDYARVTPFPDLMYGEDWPWCESMLKTVTKHVKIDRPLYHYRFDDATTEASHS